MGSGTATLASAPCNSVRRAAGQVPMNLVVMCRLAGGDQRRAAVGRSRASTRVRFASVLGGSESPVNSRIDVIYILSFEETQWQPCRVSGDKMKACSSALSLFIHYFL